MTIEERVKEEIQTMFGCIRCFCNNECKFGSGTINPEDCNCDAGVYREGYIKGAAEQKEADIEKACKWLEAHHEGYVGEKEMLVQMFKSTMEE